jgi:hypothetical protein
MGSRHRDRVGLHGTLSYWVAEQFDVQHQDDPALTGYSHLVMDSDYWEFTHHEEDGAGEYLDCVLHIDLSAEGIPAAWRLSFEKVQATDYLYYTLSQTGGDNPFAEFYFYAVDPVNGVQEFYLTS